MPVVHPHHLIFGIFRYSAQGIVEEGKIAANFSLELVRQVFIYVILEVRSDLSPYL